MLKMIQKRETSIDQVFKENFKQENTENDYNVVRSFLLFVILLLIFLPSIIFNITFINKYNLVFIQMVLASILFEALLSSDLIPSV